MYRGERSAVNPPRPRCSRIGSLGISCVLSLLRRFRNDGRVTVTIARTLRLLASTIHSTVIIGRGAVYRTEAIEAMLEGA